MRKLVKALTRLRISSILSAQRFNMFSLLMRASMSACSKNAWSFSTWILVKLIGNWPSRKETHRRQEDKDWDWCVVKNKNRIKTKNKLCIGSRQVLSTPYSHSLPPHLVTQDSQLTSKATRLYTEVYSPSYICTYWGNPAAFSHLHASLASLTAKKWQTHY